ncbi:MAG: hypothetical protein ISS26_00595 [Candidatus Omnitrophica bacterium]|nr:hypothetical protein [Candidatus Omnitrophota bacterium]
MRGRFPVLFIIFFITASLPAGNTQPSGEEVFVYKIGDRRDPFMPLVTGQKRLSLGIDGIESVEDVKFEGVIFDPYGNSVAVLNSEIVGEGDKINNVEIIKIMEKAITLKIHGETHTIDLEVEGGIN